jgi:hypothetical protein
MSVRYCRVNRAAYTARGLSAITVGPRRLLLPALIARLFLLKTLEWDKRIGDPIADTLNGVNPRSRPLMMGIDCD